MIQYSSFRQPESGYYLENNNYVLPDNYMLNFDAWCDEVQPKVEEGRNMYKWEDKVDTVFWRGKLTGMNLD